ncbi:hypothetical protein [Alicyclobacillus acidoterrestris]|uniref:Uncharacterized protein n=1 Tax=Alicyclobacillus acidoterrestris (strain ATCC 49025 / DSM 3922 / CIP 106132 / NCIMB 13137 / GD3B) TaxID=1356854 RepID=T0D882_ALIAG|nr:hypothetical protein [Alicyclobacillus acidoterrestris]EPZ47722.1 hypothetical protein N007_05560 [Alicyclobacillus acidoterrestris ATCC 49025]UNO47969.1 hypothetical protein K1I37_14945 [Alicyclobacillus acidoterrestris]
MAENITMHAGKLYQESGPIDMGNLVELRQMVIDLTRRVEALESKHLSIEQIKALYGMGKIPLFDNEADELRVRSEFAATQQQYTREQVIEMAKRDVDELMMTQHLHFLRDGITITLSYEDKIDFVVNRDKRTVVALIKSSGKVWARGIAKCQPDDCFNVHIGKAIALYRALGLMVLNMYLNAPQPTEAQVGDVIKWPTTSATYVVKTKYASSANIECLSSDRFVFRGKRYYGRDISEAVIIDDSHDFGGEVM